MVKKNYIFLIKKYIFNTKKKKFFNNYKFITNYFFYINYKNNVYFK
ncbi:MAG: hypothetical protein ACH6QQ_00685 [Candidatus Carsonella ruddii]